MEKLTQFTSALSFCTYIGKWYISDILTYARIKDYINAPFIPVIATENHQYNCLLAIKGYTKLLYLVLDLSILQLILILCWRFSN